MPETYNDQNQLILSLLCITALIVSAVYYAKSGTSNGYLDDPDVNTTYQIKEDASKNDSNILSTPKLGLKPQPSCPPLDKSLELAVICAEYLSARLSCTPEDILNPIKHKIPKYYYRKKAAKNNSNDTQNTIVNYVIAIVLLTSLGAALLEFYRAKMCPSSGNEKKGNKNPTNRKCSLADLTVLKHHRRELMRRESILEQPFEGESGEQYHQGVKPSPLRRRCSFPASLPSSSDSALVGGYGGRRNSRKLSTAGDFGRRLSVVSEGDRKLSMVGDDAVWRRGSVIGEDSSPERRHHTRLVHRH
ncbi:uncharacterized protein [Euwallacea similis]|uniref:uncharacterized protein isoform X1 n=1 Tax=Euwallacea similis TaxID=1736056 RepID=UPI00344E9C49